MRVIMFKDQFAELVRTGKKLQTIRPVPKRIIKVGDKLSLRRWTGLPYRSKQEVLADAVNTDVLKCEVGISKLMIDGTILRAPGLLNKFAALDGFPNWQELEFWFARTHGLPFNGVLIRWRLEVGK